MFVLNSHITFTINVRNPLTYNKHLTLLLEFLCIEITHTLFKDVFDLFDGDAFQEGSKVASFEQFPFYEYEKGTSLPYQFLVVVIAFSILNEFSGRGHLEFTFKHF